MAEAAVSSRESLAGPQGSDADVANWHSVRLELQPGGRFELELWRFHESFCYHASDAGAAAARREEAAGRQQPTHHMSEIRATLSGRCAAAAAGALRLRGLDRQELNQTYVQDASLQLGGQPTWWSADGRHFLYFVEEHRHWKANAVRSASGDGLSSVGPGRKRAGRGWAHSGVAGADEAPEAALRRGGGWFELEGGAWAAADVQVEPCSEMIALEFAADQVLFEEQYKVGEEVSQEKHQADEVILFHGWRLGRTGDLRLALPAMPEAVGGEEDAEAEPEMAASPEDGRRGGVNFLGDPDSVVLRRCARL